MIKIEVSNHISEKIFIKKYGQGVFDEIKKNAFIKSRGCCAACRHSPPESKKETALSLHIPTENINKETPSLTEGFMLCKACHATQHIEASIKNDWIVLVNSVFSQVDIVRATRSGQIYGAIESRNIIQLKKTPQEFLDEFYKGEAKFSSTLKIAFTNNFQLDDL